MNSTTHPYFVPADTEGTRKETAILLVGTAREFGIPQREIASTMGGFNISQRVFDAVWPTDEVEEATTKTSGNRAAKNSTKEEE